MPKYRIGLCQRHDTVEQIEVDLPDVGHLRTELSEFAGQLLKDAPESIWKDEDWHIEAKNAAGLTLYRLVIFAGKSPAMVATVDG